MKVLSDERLHCVLSPVNESEFRKEEFLTGGKTVITPTALNPVTFISKHKVQCILINIINTAVPVP